MYLVFDIVVDKEDFSICYAVRSELKISNFYYPILVEPNKKLNIFEGVKL